jgi:hypothetical protein
LNIRGNILVDFNEKPLLLIDFKDEKVIEIDVKDTSLFDVIEIEHDTNKKSNFWDMLHNARDFAETLKEKKLTIVLSIKGKETIIIGEKAKPSISQILSKSKNIQIKSVTETAKLTKEILD